VDYSILYYIICILATYTRIYQISADLMLMSMMMDRLWAIALISILRACLVLPSVNIKSSVQTRKLPAVHLELELELERLEMQLAEDIATRLLRSRTVSTKYDVDTSNNSNANHTYTYNRVLQRGHSDNSEEKDMRGILQKHKDFMGRILAGDWHVLVKMDRTHKMKSKTTNLSADVGNSGDRDNEDEDDDRNGVHKRFPFIVKISASPASDAVCEARYHQDHGHNHGHQLLNSHISCYERLVADLFAIRDAERQNTSGDDVRASASTSASASTNASASTSGSGSAVVALSSDVFLVHESLENLIALQEKWSHVTDMRMNINYMNKNEDKDTTAGANDDTYTDSGTGTDSGTDAVALAFFPFLPESKIDSRLRIEDPYMRRLLGNRENMSPASTVTRVSTRRRRTTPTIARRKEQQESTSHLHAKTSRSSTTQGLDDAEDEGEGEGGDRDRDREYLRVLLVLTSSISSADRRRWLTSLSSSAGIGIEVNEKSAPLQHAVQGPVHAIVADIKLPPNPSSSSSSPSSSLSQSSRVQYASKILTILSHQPEVLWIEPYPEHFTHNRWARGVCQSGSWSSTPFDGGSSNSGSGSGSSGLFAGNLTGRGQIIGISDTGLDTRSCFFYDPDNATVKSDDSE
jgi:hypothetical protein